ncbi:hypothetical protein COO60DRAFT_1583158 [Scenedesmus sp. NREL 46B-D3]|nr:hypothetical protein COO60DRAFT_1583158 [Scenedesmus sp. NREL 46B-D3]
MTAAAAAAAARPGHSELRVSSQLLGLLAEFSADVMSSLAQTKVPLAWLGGVLPRALHPISCSVAQFAVSSTRCGLLQPADTGCVKLRPGYIYTLRSHSLCRRLLQELLQYARGHCHQLEMNVSMLSDSLTRVRGLRPLQLYRLLYSRLVGFVADMVSGGDEVLVGGGQGAQQVLLPAAALRRGPPAGAPSRLGTGATLRVRRW